jgi:flagellar protein FlaG
MTEVQQMANDVGPIKSVLTPGFQANPTAPAGRPVTDTRLVGRSGATGDAEQRQEGQSLDSVVSDLNSMVRELHRELRFSIDKDSGDTVVKVVDRETDEVVRQIPSEELMRLRRRLEEAAGAIFQDSA